MVSNDKNHSRPVPCFGAFFDCPEIKPQKSKIVLRITHEPKISGDFPTIESTGSVKIQPPQR